MVTDLSKVIEQDHEALHSLMRGNAEPKKRLYSRAEDATLAKAAWAAGSRVGSDQ